VRFAILLLHLFIDASQEAYGAVSYAPMKVVTIPRLELMAAVVAVQLCNILSQEMRLTADRSVFWADNMTALQYIKNRSRRFNTFVANRINVLHDSSSPEQWRYVNSELNPADDVSRGLSASDLVGQWSSFCLEGRDRVAKSSRKSSRFAE